MGRQGACSRPELARDAADEASLRAACALPGYAWDYLRFVREDGAWRPAAGVFPGWPARAAEITLLDPCCGSGHFLTEALTALAALRGAEEGLSPADAVLAVLRDNLHGLEIDGRCVQIAAFALALTAWRIGGAEAKLPTPHVAWVGAPPPLPKPEFAGLANGDVDLRRGLEALHDLFAQAPLLGSLIEPLGGDLVDPTRIARIEEASSAWWSGCAARSRSGRRAHLPHAVWLMRQQFWRGASYCRPPMYRSLLNLNTRPG